MGLTSSIVGKQTKLTNPKLDWNTQKALGSGTYGKVYKVQHKRNGDVAAAKVAELESKDQLYNFKEEIEILETRRHMNLTALVDCYWFNNKDLWIILELCEGGSLNGVAKKLGRRYNEAETANICCQSLSGLEFLHENQIIHRDLNASNIMLSASGLVKIGDFGVAAILKNDRERRSSFIGSPNWLAPEVARCENDPSSTYDYKADIWSFGSTCMELIQGQPPYHDLNAVKVIMKLATNTKAPPLMEPSNWSQALTSFISRAMTVDPTLRPSAGALGQDDFCRGKSNREALSALVSP
eukprot:TRINITY_DN11541_c1_g2_i2.p3 TRINITY_DN11541_c1_g2~~TRINITY_DN11541_c1_g2_i2.p3  ORF type:complete len:297 (+),score=36.12 TRINITY_DN11541_c1_g2_i2:2907-3797(+)